MSCDRKCAGAIDALVDRVAKLEAQLSTKTAEQPPASRMTADQWAIRGATKPAEPAGSPGQCDMHDRLETIVDEAFGMQPVMSTEDLLTFLEKKLHPSATKPAEPGRPLSERMLRSEIAELRGINSALEARLADAEREANAGRYQWKIMEQRAMGYERDLAAARKALDEATKRAGTASKSSDYWNRRYAEEFERAETAERERERYKSLWSSVSISLDKATRDVEHLIGDRNAERERANIAESERDEARAEVDVERRIRSGAPAPTSGGET